MPLILESPDSYWYLWQPPQPRFLVPAAITRAQGPSAWLALSVGQSAGAVAAIIINSFMAPPWPSGCRKVHAGGLFQLYLNSLTSRLPAYLITAPLAAIASAALVADHRLLAGVAGLTFSANGLTAVWYYIGSGSAVGAFLAETGPRVFVTVVAVVLISGGYSPLIYPGLLLFTTIVILMWTAILAKRVCPQVRLVLNAKQIVPHFRYTWSRVLFGAYFDGSTTVVAALAPEAAFLYSSLDRIVKSTFNASLALPYGLVPTVARQATAGKRVLGGVLAFHLLSASVIAGILYTVLPLASEIMYSGYADVGPTLRTLVALVAALAYLNRALIVNLYLPAHLDAIVARLGSTLAVLGLLALAFGALRWGTEGALTATVVFETLGIGLGLLFYFRASRKTLGAPLDGAEGGIEEVLGV